MSRKIQVAFNIIAGGFIVLSSFQNCSSNKFTTYTPHSKTICTDSPSTSGCGTIAESSVNSIDSQTEGSNQSSTSNVATTNNSSATNSTNSADANSSSNQPYVSANSSYPDFPIIKGETVFNFVSSTKQDCEFRISQRFGFTGSCAIGGGCGVSCGVPNGSSCVSANPNLYGACIQASFGSDSIGSTVSQVFNFVDADAKNCSNSMAQKLGISASCTVGGGCGESCDLPDSNCQSANPTLPGACVLGYFKLQSFSSQTATGSGTISSTNTGTSSSSPVLHNVVDGLGKVSCESSIQSSFGLNITCTLGGGCGVSCGIPNGSTCISANPGLYGACFYK